MVDAVGSGRGPGLTLLWGVALRIGKTLDTLLSWGLEPSERNALLAERHDDRCCEAQDPESSIFAYFVRTVRTAVGDLAQRLADQRVTTIPTSIMYVFVCIGTVIIAMRPISTSQRVAYALIISGLVVTVITGVRHPLMIVKKGMAAGSMLISTGAFLDAATIDLDYQTLSADLVRAVAISTLGGGYLLMAIGLLTQRGSPHMLLIGGTVALGSYLLLALGESMWAAKIVAYAPGRALGAAAIAIGALLGAHSFGRLRHLPVG